MINSVERENCAITSNLLTTNCENPDFIDPFRTANGLKEDKNRAG